MTMEVRMRMVVFYKFLCILLTTTHAECNWKLIFGTSGNLLPLAQKSVQLGISYWDAAVKYLVLFLSFFAEGAGNGFAHFWITDSCAPTVNQVMGKPPFEVLSLAGSIAVALHI